MDNSVLPLPVGPRIATSSGSRRNLACAPTNVVPGTGNSDGENQDCDEDQPQRFHRLSGTLRTRSLIGLPRTQLVDATHTKILCHVPPGRAVFLAGQFAETPLDQPANLHFRAIAFLPLQI